MGLGSVLLEKNDVWFVSKHVVQRLLALYCLSARQGGVVSLNWVVAMSAEAPVCSGDSPNLPPLGNPFAILAFLRGVVHKTLRSFSYIKHSTKLYGFGGDIVINT